MSNGNGSQSLGYARAIYELALESWQQNLLMVKENLASNPNQLTQLNNTQTSFTERQKQLDNILPPDITQQNRNFFYTLLKDGNLHLVGEITDNLLRLSTKGIDLQIATVTTAIPLTETEKEQFRQKLAAKHGDQLEVDFAISKDIIGGVVVQVGDKILDGSVATKLNKVRDSLLT